MCTLKKKDHILLGALLSSQHRRCYPKSCTAVLGFAWKGNSLLLLLLFFTSGLQTDSKHSRRCQFNTHKPTECLIKLRHQTRSLARWRSLTSASMLMLLSHIRYQYSFYVLCCLFSSWTVWTGRIIRRILHDTDMLMFSRYVSLCHMYRPNMRFKPSTLVRILLLW